VQYLLDLFKAEASADKFDLSLRGNAIAVLGIWLAAWPSKHVLFRKIGGIEALCSFLSDRTVIISALTSAPQVIAFVIDCIWSVVLNNDLGLHFFVAHEGVDLLLQLLTVCPYFLVKQLLSCLSDLLLVSEDARSHFHEWHSSLSQTSSVVIPDNQRTAVSILLRLFLDETHRLAGDSSVSIPRPQPPVKLKQSSSEKKCECTQGHPLIRYNNKLPPGAADGWYNCQVCASRNSYLNLSEQVAEKLHIDSTGGGWSCSYCNIHQCLSCVAFALAYKSTESQLADLLGSESVAASSSVKPLPIPVPPGYSKTHGVTDICVRGLSQQDIRSAIFCVVLAAEAHDSSIWSYCSEEQKVQLTVLKNWLDTKKAETYSQIRSEFLAEQSGLEAQDGLLGSVGWWESAAFRRSGVDATFSDSPIISEDEKFLQIVVLAQSNQEQHHSQLQQSAKQEISQQEEKELSQFFTSTSHHIHALKSNLELVAISPSKNGNQKSPQKYEAGANLHVRKRVSVQQANKLAASYSSGG
jgi:hypothetical protein